MLFVITGNGKGKTTSSLGMVERAIGNNGKCLVIQFIKDNVTSYGEYKSLTSQGVNWLSFGEGFTWNLEDTSRTSILCKAGFKKFCETFESQEYSMIVLDEFTYAMNLGFVEEKEFLSFISEHKQNKTHVVVTGRDASENLIKAADTVSEIKEIKHHFYSNGDNTVKGIEF